MFQSSRASYAVCLWMGLLFGAVFDAAAITANVTVTAGSAGTITATQLAVITSNTEAGPPGGTMICSAGPVSGLVPSTGSNCFKHSPLYNNWTTGTFAILAGTHTYQLNIASSANSASLDQLLCGTSGGLVNPPCNVGICLGGTTNTNHGSCTASSGQIIPTCLGGHVVSVTSNLTLTCP